MPDDRDPLLQNLFAEAQLDLSGEAFTEQVMARTRNFRYLVVAGLFSVALILAVIAWLLAIPLELAQLVTQLLTITLIDLGDSWIAWILSPINNIASLIVLSVKATRLARERIIGISYA